MGGGLSGLTVARRLSEAGDKTVLVIEAGGDNRNDPRVQSIYAYVGFVPGRGLVVSS